MYTQTGDTALERRIQTEVDLVRDHLVAHVPGLEALFLVGGFGRGEGSVVQAGDHLEPCNDYDFVLVVSDEAPAIDARALSEALLPRVRVRLLDFITVRRRKLSRLKPEMFNVDLQQGSIAVWGDATLLERVPDLLPASIDVRDARTLLRNRLTTCLEAFSTEADATGPGSLDGFVEKQAAKVVFACIDATLAGEGRYKTRYEDKRDGFRSGGRDPVEAALAAQAYRVKVAAKSGIADAAEFRRQACALYQKTLVRVMGGSLLGWMGPRGVGLRLRLAELRSPKRFLERWRRGALRYPLYSAQAMLVFTSEKRKESDLRRVRRLLAYYDGAPTEGGWEALRKRSIELWYSMMH